jgi:pyridoxine kinase
MPFTVLSIQSHVVAGHVGNDAAAFALQRLGIEVWPVHTVQFSNHPGHGAWTGQAFAAEHVRSLIDGLDARGYLRRVDAVLSGYVGSAATGAAIADAVLRVKAQNGNAIYCCDPVMGDVGPGLFVQPDVPSFFADTALAFTDILTPNVFELSLLTGVSTSALGTKTALLAAARQLIAHGPRIVLVTSARVDSSQHIATLAVTALDAWRVITPHVALTPMPNGMGDCIAALFLGRYLQHGDIARALSQSVSSLYALVRGTDASMPRDLNLIALQDALVHAPETFHAELL